ncbi:hypothetical protein [Pseudooceanicola sp. HF7]|uniref:hypothetical protein n=1 Tax=Pseudooceanicola sp. HF7 TaxID=2721560 RepID=UPI00142F5302|nr:hypothetical protein [Pseudooceanicola sp. HF7]NIZ11102.1 hypothetical protein [Pseudooceanicola sp. HF7]
MFDAMGNTRAAVRSNVGMFAVLAAVVAISGGTEVWDQLSRYRGFRDITLQTPFRRVTVEQEPVAGGLVLRGTMVKARCVYDGMMAYAVMPSALRRPIRLDLSAEIALWGGGSRPPSSEAEVWGPWRLDAPPSGHPVAWEVWSFHLCPEGRQANLFASAPWSVKG